MIKSKIEDLAVDLMNFFKNSYLIDTMALVELTSSLISEGYPLFETEWLQEIKKFVKFRNLVQR